MRGGDGTYAQQRRPQTWLRFTTDASDPRIATIEEACLSRQVPGEEKGKNLFEYLKAGYAENWE